MQLDPWPQELPKWSVLSIQIAQSIADGMSFLHEQDIMHRDLKPENVLLDENYVLLSLRDLALSRTVCTFFEAYWQEKFSNNVLPLRIGNDVATIDRAMRVIEILSSRREYTKINPFLVLLDLINSPINTMINRFLFLILLLFTHFNHSQSTPPPNRPPNHLWKEYTLNHTIPIQGWYFDSTSSTSVTAQTKIN